MLFKIALKNLLGARLRTFLNVLVTAFSFFLILFVSGMYNGMLEHAKQVTMDTEIAGGAYWHPEYDPLDPMTFEDAHSVLPGDLQSLVDQKKAFPVLVSQASIYPGGRIMPVIMKGIPPGQNIVNMPTDALAGRDDIAIPVLIGKGMARDAKLEVGDAFTIRWLDADLTYDADEGTVVNIMDTENFKLDMGHIWIPLEKAQTMLAMEGKATYVTYEKELQPVNNLLFYGDEQISGSDSTNFGNWTAYGISGGNVSVASQKFQVVTETDEANEGASLAIKYIGGTDAITAGRTYRVAAKLANTGGAITPAIKFSLGGTHVSVKATDSSEPQNGTINTTEQEYYADITTINNTGALIFFNPSSASSTTFTLDDISIKEKGVWIPRDINYLVQDMEAIIAADKPGAQIMYMILLALAAMGIFNAQVLSIFRRGREIGTLMAIGMTRPRVVGLFTLEGGLNAVLAAVATLIFFGPVLWYFGVYGIPMPIDYTEMGMIMARRLIPIYTIGLVVSTTILVSIIVLIVSYIPSRRIARMKPTDALRGKAVA